MPERPAYAIVEAFKERQRDKDRAYGAVMQAHSSARAHDTRDEMIFGQTLEAYGQRVYESRGGWRDIQLYSSIAFPVVVVDGRMFECFLNAKGEAALSETDAGMVLVPGRERADPFDTVAYDSVVRVVTEGLVESVSADAKKCLDTLLSQEEALTEVWEYERSRLAGETEPDEIPF
jgi:hypothetical protein